MRCLRILRGGPSFFSGGAPRGPAMEGGGRVLSRYPGGRLANIYPFFARGREEVRFGRTPWAGAEQK